jgi:hypothetical protein
MTIYVAKTVSSCEVWVHYTYLLHTYPFFKTAFTALTYFKATYMNAFL